MSTRSKVLGLHARGLTVAEIATAVGVTKPTVCYHLRRAGIAPDERFRRRYDWAEIQRFYDQGNSISACQREFGFARCTWNEARLRGDVVSRPNGMPLDELLSGPRNRGHIKGRLIRLGLKSDACESCGLSEWRGAPLTVELHHVNGNGQDNRLENLQLLCPNCHSQTENFGGRNRLGTASPDPPATA